MTLAPGESVAFDVVFSPVEPGFITELVLVDAEPGGPMVDLAARGRGPRAVVTPGSIPFGPAARAFLKGEERVELVLPPARQRRSRRDNAANPVGDPIFDALRECRRDLAKEAGVPPYVIFHDSTLREMARIRPKSERDLALVNGVGERKLEAYGAAFLAVLRQF